MANISTVSTPQMGRVRELCLQAKSMPEGLIVWFKLEKYGDLKSCKSAARSMQVTFCNLRVRSRRLMQRMKGESTADLLAFTRGEFDDIACVVRPIPFDKGYTVRFSPAYSIDMDLEITDAATGEPFKGEDPTMNRFITLMGKVFHEERMAMEQRREVKSPFTREELQFMWEYSPEECERMNIWPLAPGASVVSSSGSTQFDSTKFDRSDYASVDLASLGEEDLEFDNGEGSV